MDLKRFVIWALLICAAVLALVPLTAQQPQQPPYQLPPELRAKVEAKVDELDKLIAPLKAKKLDADLLADVEVHAKAARFLLEFPATFFSEQGVTQALTVLDQGIERARQLESGQSPWVMQKGRKALGYYSPLDGSVQPMGVTIPASYDGSKPVRLYVWLHGRSATLSEANFIAGMPNPVPQNSTAWTADLGQITIDAYGRWNNANHWSGEIDIYEAIAAVQRRFKIDPDRIVLRGFSLGGAGAWHNALHRPGFWAAAEIGAGTWPRRSQIAEKNPQMYPPYQRATLRIWENITEWALNACNLPIAGHGGDSDPQPASIPRPMPGEPTRGQLESSIKVREQLAREGFPSEGEPNFMRAAGTPSIFLISANTGHSISPPVREKVDAFLKEWGDRGRVSPDHIKFLTYTTRFNASHWVSVDAMNTHYERAEVDARRTDGGARYLITTKNVARLTLRETGKAGQLNVDGQDLKVRPAATLTFERSGERWRAVPGKIAGLRKTHGLQGPIDDAFLEGFLLVRPTGTPWNEAANRHALAVLDAFDRTYARWYRAHPRVKDDKDVTQEDFERYNVALFGDPGSNRWIAKVSGKLPVKWSKITVAIGTQSFPAGAHLPAMVYPNPLNPARYVVLNSGLTISPNEYQSDYSMPRLGDFAILKVKDNVEPPEPAFAGLFNEFWKVVE